MNDIILNLNETARDAALVQCLIKSRVNQKLLAAIFCKLYNLTDEELNRRRLKEELEQTKEVFVFLGKIARDANLSNLLNLDHQ